MRMKKKISIIVPVYNAEKYLRECIDSLIGQTLSDLEIIMINDASTDRSLDILLEYEQSYPDHVQVYSMKKNCKQGAARNMGIRKAQGKYLLFVDSDDLLESQACERLYQKAEAEQADIVFCDYMMFTDQEEEYCQHVQQVYLGKLTIEKKKALLTTSVVPWAKLLLRSLIIDHSIFFPEHVFYEDQATTYLYYLYADRAAKVEEALYRYRLTENSTASAQNEVRHFQQMDMSLVLANRFAQRGFSNVYEEELEYFLIEQMYCLGVQSCFEKFDEPPKEYLNQLLFNLYRMCPNYQQNTYYQHVLSERYKKMLETHRESVERLIAVYESGELDSYCPNYTYQLQSSQEKINRLADFFLKKKYQTILWGAGKYGNYIIKNFERCKYRFNYLVDIDSGLWGKKCEEYVVLPIYKVKEADLVLIEYSCYAYEIRRELERQHLNIKTIDLEIYIKHNLNLPLEEYLE